MTLFQISDKALDTLRKLSEGLCPHPGLTGFYFDKEFEIKIFGRRVRTKKPSGLDMN